MTLKIEQRKIEVMSLFATSFPYEIVLNLISARIMDKKYQKTAVVAVVRNEGHHIAEWIAYQIACGFDSVVLFNNMSTDDTAARAAALKGSVDLRLHDWPIFEADYQRRAYIHAARLYEWEFSWMAFFDMDEFLVLEEGKDLSDLLFSQFGSAGIAVPWAMYGSSGHRNRPNGLVIDNYIYRSNNDFPPNRHVKTIARPERIIDFGHVHMPTIDGRYTDLMGREISFSAPGIMNSRPDYRGGKLHHYFTRSWEDWLIKIQRGYNDTVRPVDEFYSYDLNNVFDDSARRLLSRVAFYLSAHKL